MCLLMLLCPLSQESPLSKSFIDNYLKKLRITTALSPKEQTRIEIISLLFFLVKTPDSVSTQSKRRLGRGF